MNNQSDEEMQQVQNMTVKQQESNVEKYCILLFCFILLFAIIYNLYALLYLTSSIHITQMQNQQQVKLEVEKEEQKFETNKLETSQTPNKIHLQDHSQRIINQSININSPQYKQKVIERVKQGQPTPTPLYFLKAKIITNTKIDNSQNCLFFNSITLLTKNTISTSNNFSKTKKIKHTIFLMDKNDKFSQRQLQQRLLKFKKHDQITQHQIIFDYQNKNLTNLFQTLKCKKIIYLHHNFELNQKQSASLLLQIQKKFESNSLLYTSHYFQIKNKQKSYVQLPNLTKINLQKQLTPIELNKYIFCFDPELWSIVAPLNFAFYNKYTVEQIIIYPLLALTQKSKYLQPITHTSNSEEAFHGLEQAKIQFKEFLLENYVNEKQICFVSYPQDPYKVDQYNALRYLNSLVEIKEKEFISIIVFVPYGGEIMDIGLKLLAMRPLFENVRLVVRVNKIVSSLSVYQAAYTYCSDKSLIVSSRHNIAYKSNFVETITNQINQKYHYYITNYISSSAKNIKVKKQKWIKSYNLRQNPKNYEINYKHIQIFKSDLFKMNYFWDLKCAEIDFYQTQASFVIPLLEMIRLDVGVINSTLFSVLQQRRESETQIQQFNNLKRYFEWPQIIDNRLQPYKYNCLQNVAFRRGAKDKIPKIIHQAWIVQDKISDIRAKLHQTLQYKNPEFNMYLWKETNLTFQNFPLTYSLIWRTLEFQKTSERSYSAPVASLIRYQAMYNHGGIYFDFKTEGRKPLDPFLKYQIFFTDTTFTAKRFPVPNNVGNPMMGAMQHSYYLKLILTELISQDTINYDVKLFPKIVGAYMLRKTLNDKQLFTSIGLGFQLFSPRPLTQSINDCGFLKDYKQKQQIFKIKDWKTGKNMQIRIPCLAYPEAYALMYKPLGRTWLGKRQK